MSTAPPSAAIAASIGSGLDADQRQHESPRPRERPPACSARACAPVRPRRGRSAHPAATRAEYSPRLWPATTAGVRPRARKAATLTSRIAGWVLAVWRSSLLRALRARCARAEAERVVGLCEQLANGRKRARTRSRPCRPPASPGRGRRRRRGQHRGHGAMGGVAGLGSRRPVPSTARQAMVIAGSR